MNRSRWLWLFYGLLVLVAGWVLVYYYPRLPERMATQFDGLGEPTGWSSKASFVRTHALMLALLALLFPALWLLLPRIPVSMINLPNKQFWLDPVRWAYALSLIRDFVMLSGCFFLLFLDAMTYLTLQTNLTPHPRLGPAVWVITGIYLSLTLASVGGLVWFFKKPHRWL